MTNFFESKTGEKLWLNRNISKVIYTDDRYTVSLNYNDLKNTSEDIIVRLETHDNCAATFGLNPLYAHSKEKLIEVIRHLIREYLYKKFLPSHARIESLLTYETEESAKS